MTQIFAGLAILTGGLYSGAAWYLAVVELPALRSLPPETAHRQWAQSLRRTPRYAAFSLVAAAAAFAAGGASPRTPWSWAAVAIFGVLPFTVLFILPLQRKLLAARNSADWTAGLERWSRLHMVRTILALAATVVFVATALTRS